MAHVALRMTAGIDLAEIATMCERERESFRHLPVPEGRPISKGWVSARRRSSTCGETRMTGLAGYPELPRAFLWGNGVMMMAAATKTRRAT